MALLLKCCRFVVTEDPDRRILENTDVRISDNKISEIGNGLKSDRGDEIMDCSQSLVMPGMINTHTHIAMAKQRGIADDIVLEDFLEKTGKVDAGMKEKDVYEGALLGCLESIKFGTTCFNDLYYFEDDIARASLSLGLRANLAWACLDKEMTTQKGDPVKNCEKFVKSWKGKEDLISPEVGVQGVYVTGEETYRRAAELADEYDVKTHGHLSETRKEVYDCVKQNGKRPPELLESAGMLNDRFTAAHCVWLTKREMGKLAEAGVSPSHNPASNLKLSSGGLAPVPEMLERGTNVCLGTDSVASNNNLDMFKEMKLAAMLHANAKWDARIVPAQAALDMAMINGARALGVDAGSIAEGKLADIIISDLREAHLNPVNNIVSNIVYSMSGKDVSSTIINGEIVMRDGRVEKEEEILKNV
jgi:5-methylthioadenosine/S-adenosylhomocysteine deaminase